MSEELEPSIYDDEPISMKKPSKRWPDMHGGSSKASAEPDNRPEFTETETGSTVTYKQREKQILESIHGDASPKSHLPVLINMHNTNIEMLKTLKSIDETLRYQVPLGQTRGFRVNFTTSNTRLVHIDFVDPTQTVLQSGMTPINEPGHKLTSLQLINDNSGTAVQFSTNLPRGDLAADVVLPATTSTSPPFTVIYQYPTIWSLSMVPVSGTPNIRGVYTF